MGWRIVTLVLCIMTVGCAAKVTHQMVTKADDGSGIRYYDSAPYLLVYSDGRNGLVWEIIYLPDQSHVMMATPVILGGQTQMTLGFSNGVLTNASSIGDTTALPKALIAAVQTALPLLAAAGAGQAQPGFPAPYLYKLVVGRNANGQGVLSFKGGQGNTSIQVPIAIGPVS